MDYVNKERYKVEVDVCIGKMKYKKSPWWTHGHYSI